MYFNDVSNEQMANASLALTIAVVLWSIKNNGLEKTIQDLENTQSVEVAKKFENELPPDESIRINKETYKQLMKKITVVNIAFLLHKMEEKDE